MTSWIIWIHQSFPYVKAIKCDKNENLNDLVFTLNWATKNADRDQLEKDINVLKEIYNSAVEKKTEQDNLITDLSINFIECEPCIFEIEKELKNRLESLQNIQSSLQSIEEVTIDQFRSNLWEGEKINGWSYSLDLELNLPDLALTRDERLEIDLTPSRRSLKNYGKAGILEILCLDNEKTYKVEDENVFKALEEIVSIVFNEKEELGLEKVSSDSKYYQDPKLQKMKKFVNKFYDNSSPPFFDFLFYVDMNPDFVNEKSWKEALSEIKRMDKSSDNW